jgi:hypothetical protein
MNGSGANMGALLYIDAYYDIGLEEGLRQWIYNSVGPSQSQLEIMAINSDKTYSPKNYTGKTLQEQAADSLKKIQAAFKNRVILQNNELEFLNIFSSPVYQIINQISVDPIIMDMYIKQFESLASAQLAYEVLLGVAKHLRHAQSIAEKSIQASGVYTPGEESVVAAHLVKMNDNLNFLLEISYEIYMDEYSVFKEKIVELDQMKRMATRMEAQMARHPIMGSYLLGKGFTF